MRQLLGGPRHTMRQLNSALDDALAGFDFVDKPEDNGLVIDENPRKVNKGSPIKLKLNVAKSASVQDSSKKRKLTISSRATLEDMRMTKAHQVCKQIRMNLSTKLGYQTFRFHLEGKKIHNLWPFKNRWRNSSRFVNECHTGGM